MSDERVIKRRKEGLGKPKRVKRALKLGKINVEQATEYIKRIEIRSKMV